MQSFIETPKAATISYEQREVSRGDVSKVTAILLVSAVFSEVAIQLVKIFGLANGMDEHTRMLLSYAGLAICFVAAPAFLLYGRHLSMKTGLALGASVVFVATLLASMIS